MKLIDKLKPEVIEALDEAKIQYSASYRAIFATLNSVSEYRELTKKLQNSEWKKTK